MHFGFFGVVVFGFVIFIGIFMSNPEYRENHFKRVDRHNCISQRMNYIDGHCLTDNAYKEFLNKK